MSENPNRAPLLIVGISMIAIVAAAAGAVVGLTLSIGRTPAEPPPPPPAIEPVPEPVPAPERRHVDVPPGPAPGEAPPADAVVIGKDEFLVAYRAAFAREAGRMPSTQQEEAAWGRAREAIHSVPPGFGAADGHLDADNRREIEIGDRDDILSFLTDSSRERDLLALRNDPGALTRLLAHRTIGPQLDGPTRLADRGDLVDDGTTLVFGPGVHAPSWDAIGDGRNQMPRDLTIQGAGMDVTLIRLSDFSPRDVVWNLHLRDCTIDCGNDGAFDLRNREASVFAQRVRFVRFDAGHGGCDLFTSGGKGGAVYALSCVFAGGYGSSPGAGNILEDIKVARFEDCSFERITYAVLGGYNDVGGAAFVRCVFRDCPSDITTLESEAQWMVKAGVVVDDCTAEWTLPEEARERKDLRRDLRVLFPGASER